MSNSKNNRVNPLDPEAVPGKKNPLADADDVTASTGNPEEDQEAAPQQGYQVVLEPAEWALIRLLRTVGRGHIEALDIRDGKPHTAKAGAQVFDFKSLKEQDRMIAGQGVLIDMS